MKKTIIIAISTLLGIGSLSAQAQQSDIMPDGTYLFAIKDSCELFLDIYIPARGSETVID